MFHRDEMPGSSMSSMRSVFIAATVFWNIGAIVAGILVGLHALANAESSSSLRTAGWISIAFASMTACQGILAFFKLKQSLVRYVRFGLSSAAFSRTPQRLAFAWVAATFCGLLLYVAALVEFIDASKSGIESEARSARIGIIWFSVLGITMGSLIVGMAVVSRITPWASSFFVQTPLIDEDR